MRLQSEYENNALAMYDLEGREVHAFGQTWRSRAVCEHEGNINAGDWDAHRMVTFDAELREINNIGIVSNYYTEAYIEGCFVAGFTMGGGRCAYDAEKRLISHTKIGVNYNHIAMSDRGEMRIEPQGGVVAVYDAEGRRIATIGCPTSRRGMIETEGSIVYGGTADARVETCDSESRYISRYTSSGKSLGAADIRG